MNELDQERRHHRRRRLIDAQRCPFCKAKPDAPCTHGGGQAMSRPHVARVLAATDAQKAAESVRA